MPKLVHRLRVDFERLLQELDAQKLLSPFRRAEPRRLGTWIHADAYAHDANVLGRKLEGHDGVRDGVERRVVRAVPAVDEFDDVALVGGDGLAVKEGKGRARGLDCVGDCTSEARRECPHTPVRLRDAGLEDHRPLDNESRGDDTNASLHRVEFLVLKDFVGQDGKSLRLVLTVLLLHHRRDIFFVKIVYLLHALAECKECGDDRPGARPENQIKAVVKRAFNHALDLPEHPERVKSLGPAAVQAQYSADAILAQIGVSHVARVTRHSQADMCGNA